MTDTNPSRASLTHYGVMGMKWGVRRGPQSVSTTVRPGRRVKTKGGTGQLAHPDAVRAAEYKQKAKRSTTDSLSNNELKDLLSRMDMDIRYQRLLHDNSALKRRQETLKILQNFGTVAASTLKNVSGKRA